jgi:hypothetical protein
MIPAEPPFFAPGSGEGGALPAGTVPRGALELRVDLSAGVGDRVREGARSLV